MSSSAVLPSLESFVTTGCTSSLTEGAPLHVATLDGGPGLGLTGAVSPVPALAASPDNEGGGEF